MNSITFGQLWAAWHQANAWLIASGQNSVWVDVQGLHGHIERRKDNSIKNKWYTGVRDLNDLPKSMVNKKITFFEVNHSSGSCPIYTLTVVLDD